MSAELMAYSKYCTVWSRGRIAPFEENAHGASLSDSSGRVVGQGSRCGRLYMSVCVRVCVI
jgi:hypothetical protein